VAFDWNFDSNVSRGEGTVVTVGGVQMEDPESVGSTPGCETLKVVGE
jgi:hypothetical protein